MEDAARRIWPNTICRLDWPNVAWLVVEEGKVVVYHSLDNARVFQGTPLRLLELEVDDATALEQLLTIVELHLIMAKDLSIEDKTRVAQALFDEGLLVTVSARARVCEFVLIQGHDC